MRIETPVPVEEMDDEISVSASDLPDKTMRIITQNMLFGLVFIAVAIVLSGVGLISPIAAAFIHEFGAFFVIFNSARLLRFEGKEAVAQAEPATVPI
jgi:Cd2+/Zn2+-exporting ATPase